MAKVTVHLEGEEELKAALEALARAARGAILERAANDGAEVIRAGAARRAPGPYIEKAVAQQADYAVEVEIGPDEDHWYYGFAETGAAGHAIGPKNRKALAFEGRGGEVVRFGVEHPGRPAEPFLRPAIDEDGPEAVEATGATLRRGIEAVAKA